MTDPPRLSAPDASWFLDALAASSDVALVLAADTTVVWCNAAVRQFGYAPEELVGRSMIELLHPDDLPRASDVLAMQAVGEFSAISPITPALYTVRRADGSWADFEANASAAPGADHLLVIGRVGGDLVVNDRLLEAVTAGAPLERQIELATELGLWRHPSDGFAIYYRDDDGHRRTHTANLPPELHRVAHPGEVVPWQRDLDVEPQAVELGPTVAAAARRAGFLDCLASRVPDPMHVDDAVICLWTSRVGPTSSAHRYAMDNMRRALALVLQQRAQVTMLERAVRLDELTGIMSRTRFLQLLGEAAAEAEAGFPHALLYMDLDEFKLINDSLGHVRGDEVLRVAARRLAGAAPDDAVVARLGGDEFVILCHPRFGPIDAAQLAQRVVDAFAEPISLGETSVNVTASVGVAVGSIDDTPETVLEAADRALFRAKADGKHCWRT